MPLPVRQSSRTSVRKEVKTETKTEVKKVKEVKETKSETKSAIKDAIAKMHSLPPKKPVIKDDVAKATSKSKTEPLAPRTDVAKLPKKMYIGAHISSAGGLHNAAANAAHIGGNAFALFLKPHRKWASPPLKADATRQWKDGCAEHAYDPATQVLPHGSYLVNLAQPDRAKQDQAYANFVDDLRRCQALGIQLYNFHPGAAVAGSGSRAQALARIADALNRAHRDTAPSDVVTVIENMAGGGTTVGNKFEDLRDLIEAVDDKARVGICLDTCHAFAAGYDLRTPEAFAATVAELDRVVGLPYLKAVHLNDSKAPFDSRRDVHANIGTGFLGLRAFHSLVNCDAFANMPLVLETPIDRPGVDGKDVEDRQVWADEIKLLESLIGMDPESDEYKAKEAALHKEGTQQRKRLQDQVDKRAAKDVKRRKK